MKEQTENKKEGENALKDYLPFWKQLKEEEKGHLLEGAALCRAKKGELIHRGNGDCLGFLIVRSGQLRAFVMSEEGKEITVYRLYERDMCLLAASCIFRNIDFDIWMEAREETDYWVIDPDLYGRLMEQSLPVMRYTNELMSARFSDVMWTMEQILNKSVDKRLAAFLVEEAGNEGGAEFSLTHERAARELGTAREVVSRMLKYFQQEGLVAASRGKIRILNQEALYELAKESLR